MPGRVVWGKQGAVPTNRETTERLCVDSVGEVVSLSLSLPSLTDLGTVAAGEEAFEGLVSRQRCRGRRREHHLCIWCCKVV